MKFKSQVYTQASGSIGGITYSHNQGGMYTRARATPTNRNSSQQQVVRAAIAQLTSFWLNTLTPTQRAGWATYAQNVVVLDRLGESRYITALNHFCRSNVPRIQAAGGIVGDAPTTFNLGDVTPPTIEVLSGGLTANVAFTNTDDWASEANSLLLIHFSRQQNPSINYFKGPYRYTAKVAGNSTPPTSPYVATLPFPVATGNQLFAKISVSRVDGRLSLPFLLADTF